MQEAKNCLSSPLQPHNCQKRACGSLSMIELPSTSQNYHFFKPSSAAQTNEALDFWAAVVTQNEGKVLPQWTTAKELYATIDKIQNGTTPWKTYKIRYQGPTPTENPPKWMTDTYHLCTRDSRHLLHQQLLNSDFKDKIHYTPYMQFNADGNRVYSNLMSGDWAWDQAV